MFKLIVFAIVSSGITWYSWPYLRKPDSHGFYRFFAFESILGLLLLNVNYWFDQPFSALQIISWILLCLSIVLVIPGFYLLHQLGKPKDGIVDTTVLVKAGIYKYIRHPLYGSLLFLSWGIFLKSVSPLSGGLVLVATVFVVATARVEEAENIQKFGEAYIAYIKTSKRFLPFLI